MHWADVVVEKDIPVSKVAGRGRPKGSGANLRILGAMGAGDSIWDVPRDKKNSIKTTAFRYKIKIKIRRIAYPDGTLTNKYAIWRIK